MSPCLRVFTRVLAVLATAATLLRADPAATVTVAGAEPSPDATAALTRLRVAPGLKVELWASEPLIQNLTSFCFDDLGRAYVVETGRRRTSVFDIRNFKDWVADDLALRTVNERADYLRGMLGTNAAFLAAATKLKRGGFEDFNADGVIDARDLEVESERIRLISDTNGDGRADTATTFADGFQTIVSGVAAGVLTHDTNVWFTCIPDLWRMTIRDGWRVTGSGTSNAVPGHPSPLTRSRLLTGFGVHIAFGGHDLHGLTLGPDARLYFTIADRGSWVTNREGQVLSVPDSGAVFRCEQDGSDLEVFATGLRNPQELAFDQFGNLWTGDNNGDGGDKARWTLVLEGADYGWTIGWQWLPKMGAWNSERFWHTRESNTAAYIVPPVAHIGHGPAGIAYYPGTGLGDRFNGTFFYTDFPGGVRTFRVEPDGAFFRVLPPAGETVRSPWLEDNSTTNFTGKLLWDLSPVDVAFPPGGGVVVGDWVQGWEKTGKGRLWRVFDPALTNDPVINETKRLLAEGMAKRDDRELAGLLGHRDMRVRLNAQWELAGRGVDSFARFKKVAFDSPNPLARIHALWGIEQIARALPMANLSEDLTSLIPLLGDPDEEIRNQTAKLLGNVGLLNAAGRLIACLNDTSPRVRVSAALALPMMGWPSNPQMGGRRYWESLSAKLTRESANAINNSGSSTLAPVRDFLANRQNASFPSVKPPLAELLATNSALDPVLQHAAVMAFSQEPGDPGLLWSWANGYLTNSPGVQNVRLVSALAARRTGQDWLLEQLLSDPAPQVVLEAARAINDVPFPRATRSLAALITPGLGRDDEAPSPRLSVLRNLFTSTAPAWPTNLNFTHEEWRTWVLRRAANAAFRLGESNQATALAALSVRPGVPESVRVEALDFLGFWPHPPRIDRIVGLSRPLPSRDPAPARDALAGIWPQLIADPATNIVLAALDAATALSAPELADTLTKLASHPDATLRAEAKRRIARNQPLPLADLIARAESGPPVQRQAAFATLAMSDDPAATALLTRWAARLAQGEVAPELQLDVLEAASGRATTAPSLAAWTNSWRPDDRLAAQRVSLHGGDAARGRRLFAERADWGCQRCHKLGGEGGEVGPDLTGLGRTRGRDYVLQAILYPNDAIAPGFENVIVTRKDGSTVVGVVKADTAGELVLETPEEGRLTIPKSDITARERGLSAMPDGLIDLMTRRELRDLIEALAE